MPHLYKIKNMVNDKVYIGMTIRTANSRFKDHVRRLKSHTHKNTKLQRAWDKYGEQSFKLEIIADGDFTRKELGHLEKIFIKLYNTIQDGYNIAAGGEGWNDPTGVVASRVSNTLRKRNQTPEGKASLAKMAKTKRGVLSKPEHWVKLSKVREYWRDKRNGRGGNKHPGHTKISNQFNIPRGIAKKMIEQLQQEELKPIEVDIQAIYKFWSNSENAGQSKYKHPGRRIIAQQFNVSENYAERVIKQFISNEEHTQS